MTWKILLPLDGSDAGNRGIPWADNLAAALHADVTLLRVLPCMPTSSGGKEDGDEWARHALEEARDRVQRANSVTVEIGYGAPGDAIAERAREGYDLVLMVARVERGLGRILHGSAAAEVIGEAGVPVMVLQPSLAERPPRLPHRMLVPLDGSDLSAAVLRFVAPLARQLQCMVVLLGVLPPGQRESSAFRDIGEYLHRAAAGLSRQSVASRTVVRMGQPGPCILEFAREASADLIAMSTGGAHRMDPLGLGSVTEHVLARAQAPVLAIHPLAIELLTGEGTPSDDEPAASAADRLVQALKDRQTTAA